MENFPKYFIFDRRAVGILETAKRIVEVLAGASVGSAIAFDSLSSTPLLTLILIVLRASLSAIIGMATVGNPIDIAATVTMKTEGDISQTNTKIETTGPETV